MIPKSSLTLGQCRANDQNFHRQLFGIVGELMEAEASSSCSQMLTISGISPPQVSRHTCVCGRRIEFICACS